MKFTKGTRVRSQVDVFNQFTKGKIYISQGRHPRYDNDVALIDDSGQENGLTSTVVDLVDEVSDVVNNPAHYTKGKIQVLDFIEDQKLQFHEAQVLKYVVRAKHKGNELQDLKKAKFYLDRKIGMLENANED